MNHQRPVNLDLGSLKYPPMAIASILHRISGLVLFILLPVMLYFLNLSLNSADSFLYLQTLLAFSFCKLILWAFGTALGYHVLAGIRHMLMDIGFGEEVLTASRSANLVIVLAIIVSIILGVRIW